MRKKKKGQHGGAREGSGRKPELDGPVKVIINLERGQKRKLDRLCKETSQNRSAAVRSLIDTNVKEESDNAGQQTRGDDPV